MSTRYYGLIPAHGSSTVEVLTRPHTLFGSAFGAAQCYLREEGRLSPETLQRLVVVPSGHLHQYGLREETACQQLLAEEHNHARLLTVMQAEEAYRQAAAAQAEALIAAARAEAGLPYQARHRANVDAAISRAILARRAFEQSVEQYATGDR